MAASWEMRVLTGLPSEADIWPQRGLAHPQHSLSRRPLQPRRALYPSWLALGTGTLRRLPWSLAVNPGREGRRQHVTRALNRWGNRPIQTSPPTPHLRLAGSPLRNQQVFAPQNPGPWLWGGETCLGLRPRTSVPEGNQGNSSRVGRGGPQGNVAPRGVSSSTPRLAPPRRSESSAPHRQRRPSPRLRLLRARPASTYFKSFLRPGHGQSEPWLSASGCCVSRGFAPGVRGC